MMLKRRYLQVIAALVILLAIASVATRIFAAQRSTWFEITIGNDGPAGGEMWPKKGWMITGGNGWLSIDHRSSSTMWYVDILQLAALVGLCVFLQSGIPASITLELNPTPQGLCKICGYDLRATPDRCPECGNLSTGYRPN